LFFGRLSREKGIDVLVQAFLRIAGEMPVWRLIIAGDGPERDSIERRIASSPHRDRVQLVGHLGSADVQEYAERASLAIASSRWRENMPYSIIESFAAGTPVIGTTIGGIPELVSEGETGFTCEPDDALSLSKAVLRGIDVCQDIDASRAMQRNCRSYVLEHCDQGRYMDALVTMYEKLIELKRDADA
jgi:glycosyltransferase involved in cell wall biosynthesis